jgi:archaellum component FlaF (FlaF/FlaG flagellin family)
MCVFLNIRQCIHTMLSVGLVSDNIYIHVDSYLVYIFSTWICMKYFSLDVKQPTINQYIYLFNGTYLCEVHSIYNFPNSYLVPGQGLSLVFYFPPPMKLTTSEILLKVALNTHNHNQYILLKLNYYHVITITHYIGM